MPLPESALLPEPIEVTPPQAGLARRFGSAGGSAHAMPRVRNGAARSRFAAAVEADDSCAGIIPLRRLAALLMCGDAVVVLLAFIAAQGLHAGDAHRPLTITLTAVVAVVLMLGALRGAGAYAAAANLRLRSQLVRGLLNGTAVFALLLALQHATRASDFFAPASPSVWYVVTLLGLAATRLAAWRQVARWRRRGLLARVVAVVDVGGMGRALAARIRRSGDPDLRFLGVYSLQPGGRFGIGALVHIARNIRIDDIIIAAPDADDPQVSAAVGQLGAMPINLHICTSLLDAEFGGGPSSLLLGHPVWTVHHRPLDGWDSAVKRAEDLVLGTLLVVLLLPLMTIVAVLIRLDSPGPILFRQQRLGLGNRVFEILKFRTMTHAPVPEHDVPQARPNDPRVTRIGRLLRRSSLDELPQLFNVLRGDMSLVGPRPHALPHNDQYAPVIEGYWGRHRMRPGITGWAQVHGCRGMTETLDKMQRRVDYDLDYIGRWSLLLDLKVLAMTVVVCALGWESY